MEGQSGTPDGEKVPFFHRFEVRVAGLPYSIGGDRRDPVLHALGWSIAVVLVGGVLAAFTTPVAAGPTVLRQSAGLAVPAGQDGSGSSPGSASPAGGTGSGSPADGASTATTSGSGAPPASAASATSTSSAPASPVAAAKAAPPSTTARAPAAPRLQPDPGSYPLSINGTSSVNGKAAAVPTSGSLIVTAQGGDQQHRTVGVPGGLVLVQRSTAAGVDLVSFSLTAGSKTLTFRPPSPLAFVRTDPGASWSWSVRSTDGSVTLNQTASVTGATSVNVGGNTVPAVTVQRTFKVSGGVQGTLRLTSTVSQVDRLPLLQQQSIDVRAAVLGLLSAHVKSDATATLTSTSPR